MASLIRRGRRYSIRFRHEGCQHRVTVGTSRPKAERVRAEIEGVLDDLRLGRVVVPEGVDPVRFIASGGRSTPAKQSAITFSQAADLWEAERVAAETTRKGEAKHLRHLRRAFGESRLTRLDLRAYVSSRLKTVSPCTVRKELVTLKALLKAMRAKGYSVAEVEVDRLRLPAPLPRARFASLSKVCDGRKALLTADEVLELRSLVRERGSELIADVTDFVALTGARRSEVCRLRAADVDVENRTLTITEKKRRHGHTTYRTLHIHDDLLPILKRRLASGKDVVFTESIDTLAQGLAKAVTGTRFDLKGFGYHALRHSGASRLLAANVPVTAVADVLGHADSRTTLGIYAHAFDADSRRAVALL